VQIKRKSTAKFVSKSLYVKTVVNIYNIQLLIFSVCDGNIFKLNTSNDFLWNYQWITSNALHLDFNITFFFEYN